MLSYLSICHLTCLLVVGQCQLNYDAASCHPPARLKIDTMQIGTSMTLDTIAALISHVEIEHLLFTGKCNVLHMDRYKPLPKVSHIDAADNSIYECICLWVTDRQPFTCGADLASLLLILKNASIYIHFKQLQTKQKSH